MDNDHRNRAAGNVVLAAALAALALARPLDAQEVPDRISLSNRDSLTVLDPDATAMPGVVRPPYDGPGARPRGAGEGCRALGDYVNTFIGSNRLRGDAVSVNVEGAVINEFRIELDFEVEGTLHFVIYESASDEIEGTYNRIFLHTVTVPGVAGPMLYSSGPIVGLPALATNRFYLLACAWGNEEITFGHDGQPMPFDFELGTLWARVVVNNPFPLEEQESFTFDGGLSSVGAYSMEMCLDPFPGACCMEKTCTQSDQTTCENGGGSFAGELTDCAPDPCPLLTGACCVRGGQCEERSTEFDCTDDGNEYLGDGTDCIGDPCIIAIGSCCLADRSCDETSPAECSSLGGEYGGDDTECTPDLCVPLGACCSAGSCSDDGTQEDCEAVAGTYQGDGTDCISKPCALGACCFGQLCLDNFNEPGCDQIGGIYLGNGSMCDPETSCECTVDADCPEGETCNPETAQCEVLSCEGDANGDGLVDPLDSGFVLARFGCEVGTGDPGCDTADQNGDGTVDPLDVGFVLARFGTCM